MALVGQFGFWWQDEELYWPGGNFNSLDNWEIFHTQVWQDSGGFKIDGWVVPARISQSRRPFTKGTDLVHTTNANYSSKLAPGVITGNPIGTLSGKSSQLNYLNTLQSNVNQLNLEINTLTIDIDTLKFNLQQAESAVPINNILIESLKEQIKTKENQMSSLTNRRTAVQQEIHNPTYIKKNGVLINYNFKQRGHTLAIFNDKTLALENIITYDTYSLGSGVLLSALVDVARNKNIVIVSYDSTQLDQNTRNYLNLEFGTTQLDTWDASTDLISQVAHTIIAKKAQGTVAFESISRSTINIPESPARLQYSGMTSQALQLCCSADTLLPVPGRVLDVAAILHGPYVISKTGIRIEANHWFQFYWRVVSGPSNAGVSTCMQIAAINVYRNTAAEIEKNLGPETIPDQFGLWQTANPLKYDFFAYLLFLGSDPTYRTIYRLSGWGNDPESLISPIAPGTWTRSNLLVNVTGEYKFVFVNGGYVGGAPLPRYPTGWDGNFVSLENWNTFDSDPRKAWPTSNLPGGWPSVNARTGTDHVSPTLLQHQLSSSIVSIPGGPTNSRSLIFRITTNVPDFGDVVYGPYTSTKGIEYLKVGQQVQFWCKATRINKSGWIFIAYLTNVDSAKYTTHHATVLASHTYIGSTGGDLNWTKITLGPITKAGHYKFVFINGGYDADHNGRYYKLASAEIQIAGLSII